MKTPILGLAAMLMTLSAPVAAQADAPVCDRFVSRVVKIKIEGRSCAFAYARCREGEMDANGKFTGRLKSRRIGRGKLACDARYADNAAACLRDESAVGRFCWDNLDKAFGPGKLE